MISSASDQLRASLDVDTHSRFFRFCAVSVLFFATAIAHSLASSISVSFPCVLCLYRFLTLSMRYLIDTFTLSSRTVLNFL